MKAHILKAHILFTLVCGLSAFCTIPLLAAEPWTSDYAMLLKKYATPKGVRYKAWKADANDHARLTSIAEQIAKKGPSSQARDARLAYYMDAYNIWTLKGVLDAYPIKSVRDIAPLFGFFTQPRIKVGGETMSLNKLEKEIIIKGFKEPRIHFAINCASASCPPLLPEPWTAGNLNARLDAATAEFINANPLGLSVKGDKVRLSKIFDWYKADFQPAGGAVKYVNRYRTQALPEGIKVEFQNYDWALNETR